MISTTARIYAFAPEALAGLSEAVALYGEESTDGGWVGYTLAAWRNVPGNPDHLCAARFPGTVALAPLTDGRIAAGPLYWTTAFEAAIAAEVYAAQELSPEEFAALLPTPEYLL